MWAVVLAIGWTATAMAEPTADFLIAADGGDVATVQALLAKGADVNDKYYNGDTALMRASKRGQAEMVQALLARGADVNAKNSAGHTALSEAFAKGDREVVQALLARGADVNAKNNAGWTVLISASFHGEVAMVRALLARGADVNAKNNAGYTALMSASKNGHRDVVQALLAKGANFQAKDNDGMTALMVADDAEVKALLVKAGATDDAQTAREAAAKREQTARQLAAKREYERKHPKITNEEASTEPSEADSTFGLLMQSLGTVADGMAAMKQQSNAMANRPSAPMPRSAPSSSTALQSLSQTAGSLATSNQMSGNGSSGQGGVTTTHTNNPANFATRCTSVQEDKGLFSFYFHNNCAFPIAVTWCANSKEEPNRCNTRGFNSTELNIPVGGRWPMAEGFRPISWEYLACRKDTLYYSTDMARSKQAICE